MVEISLSAFFLLMAFVLFFLPQFLKKKPQTEVPKKKEEEKKGEPKMMLSYQPTPKQAAERFGGNALTYPNALYLDDLYYRHSIVDKAKRLMRENDLADHFLLVESCVKNVGRVIGEYRKVRQYLEKINRTLLYQRPQSADKQEKITLLLRLTSEKEKRIETIRKVDAFFQVLNSLVEKAHRERWSSEELNRKIAAVLERIKLR